MKNKNTKEDSTAPVLSDRRLFWPPICARCKYGLDLEVSEKDHVCFCLLGVSDEDRQYAFNEVAHRKLQGRVFPIDEVFSDKFLKILDIVHFPMRYGDRYVELTRCCNQYIPRSSDE